MWKRNKQCFIRLCSWNIAQVTWLPGIKTVLRPGWAHSVPGGHEFDHGRNPLLNSKWLFVLVLGISISNNLKTHLQKGIDHVFGKVPLFWNGERLRESKWLKSGSYISTQPNDGHFWKRSKGTERVDSPWKINLITRIKFGIWRWAYDIHVGGRNYSS